MTNLPTIYFLIRNNTPDNSFVRFLYVPISTLIVYLKFKHLNIKKICYNLCCLKSHVLYIILVNITNNKLTSSTKKKK